MRIGVRAFLHRLQNWQEEDLWAEVIPSFLEENRGRTFSIVTFLRFGLLFFYIDYWWYRPGMEPEYVRWFYFPPS